MTRTVPKLPTILVVPNVRPSQDKVVHRYGDRRGDHRAQAPCHERLLEFARGRESDEELLEGVLKGVLEEVQL